MTAITTYLCDICREEYYKPTEVFIDKVKVKVFGETVKTKNFELYYNIKGDMEVNSQSGPYHFGNIEDVCPSCAKAIVMEALEERLEGIKEETGK
jgi:hypothetical protein